MMYFLLLCIVYILFISRIASDEKFSIDESIEDENNWNGMVVLVLSDENDEPEIVLASELNSYSQVYCLTLEEIFEADSYNTIVGDADYGVHDEVSDSEIDFQNDVTFTYTKGADNKSFVLEGVPTDPSRAGSDYSAFESIRFEFKVENSPTDETQWGLKYSFELYGYDWTSNESDAKLVLVLEFKGCESEFESLDFSSEGDEDDEEETTEEPETTVENRRRLEESSDEGISSDDSQELDVGAAEFINHGAATCVGDTSIIPTSIAFGEAVGSDELHVVFDHFECPDGLIQDPYVGVNSEKLVMDSAIRYGMYHILVVIGTMMFIF